MINLATFAILTSSPKNQICNSVLPLRKRKKKGQSWVLKIVMIYFQKVGVGLGFRISYFLSRWDSLGKCMLASLFSFTAILYTYIIATCRVTCIFMMWWCGLWRYEVCSHWSRRWNTRWRFCVRLFCFLNAWYVCRVEILEKQNLWFRDLLLVMWVLLCCFSWMVLSCTYLQQQCLFCLS